MAGLQLATLSFSLNFLSLLGAQMELLVAAFAPLTPLTQQRAVLLGAPFGLTSIAGNTPLHPLNSVKCYGELSRAMCKTQLILLPISDPNFEEKESVKSFAPTNSATPNRRSGQPMIFGFDTIQSMGTCIQLSSTTSSIFFGVCKKSYAARNNPYLCNATD